MASSEIIGANNYRKTIGMAHRKKESSRVFLMLFVLVSFFFHFFIIMLPAFVFIIIEFMMAFLFLVAKPIKTNGNHVFLWIVSFVVVFASYLISDRSNQALFNVVTIMCGIMLMIGCSKDPGSYAFVMRWVFGVSLFFAIGVLLQQMLPGVYYNIIGVFPRKYVYSLIAIEEGSIYTGGSRGFSTNSGFTAGYIVAGIFSYIALHFKKIKLKHFIMILFLLLALMSTGKRAHPVFFILTLLLVYLLAAPQNKWLSRIAILFVLLLSLYVIFDMTSDILAQRIPFFRQVKQTMNDVMEGEDYSTGRTLLYENAIELFKEHPVVGMGWRSFKKTTPDLFLSEKELDAHNIYLQLLCETGLLGFFIIVPTLLIFWSRTRKAIKKMLLSPTESSSIWRPLLWFSFAYQTFFLLYGLTGNVLYDCHYETMYFFSCAIFVSYLCVSQARNSG